jgi:hypothetical protein
VDLHASFNFGSDNSSVITGQAGLDTSLNEAENTANSDFVDLTIWPVLSIGVNYAF